MRDLKFACKGLNACFFSSGWCSHNRFSSLVRGGIRLVGNLSHKEVLDEVSEIDTGIFSIIIFDGRSQAFKIGLVLISPPDGVDDLVRKARNVSNGLGRSLHVVVEVAVVVDVGSGGAHVDVLLELVKSVASGGASTLTLGSQTGVVGGIGCETGREVVPLSIHCFEGNNAVGFLVSSVTLELLQETLVEGPAGPHLGP